MYEAATVTALQVIVFCESPADADTPVGADGTGGRGVALNWLDETLSPPRFTAVTI